MEKVFEIDSEFLKEIVDFKCVRSSGPGGQNVNKTNSKVLLILDPSDLPEHLKSKIVERCDLTKEGLLQLTCQETRDQHKNKELAIKKLETLLIEALMNPKERVLKMQDSMSAMLEDWSKKDNRHQKKKRADRNCNKRASEY